MITKSTLKPGQNGTKHLIRKYSDRLVCVRYKYDDKTGKRYTTVELIEDEILHLDLQPPEERETNHRSRLVGIRVGFQETELREQIMELGGIWRPQHKLWEIEYALVQKLGLESRIVSGGDG